MNVLFFCRRRGEMLFHGRQVVLPRTRILALIFCLLVGSVSLARPALAEAQQAQIGPAAPDQTVPAQTIALERSKFEFHKELERKKLEVEQTKAWLTGASILTPILLGWITLVLQLRSTYKLRERQAKDDFELKAAEIAMAAETPSAARNKALALAALFPGRLPSNFADEFRPEKFSGQTYVPKVEVFRAASAKAQTPQEVIMMWHLLFPAHDWIESLLAMPPQPPTKDQSET